MAAVRGLLAPWIGGASAPQAACGIRSMLAPWMGGACVGFTPTPPVCAPRSLMAFWMGGACSPFITPEPPQQPIIGGGPPQPRRFRIRPREDDDIYAITLAILHMVNNE